jgi:hypothetical protein
MEILRKVIYPLSLVVLVSSLVDLFLNRLLFRAGPDVLSHLPLFNPFLLGLVGRISVTVGESTLFLLLGAAAILLLNKNGLHVRLLGFLLLAIEACSVVLHVPIGVAQSWAISTFLVLIDGLTIAFLAWLRVRENSKRQLVLMGLLTCLVMSFLFALYYQLYLLFGAADLASLPVSLGAYQAAVYSIMATTLAAFAYALLVPSPGFKLGYRDFAKAAALPTLIVAPTLYGVMRSFFVAQILAMVVAMSTGFVLSHDMLRLLVALWWFFLTAVFLILLKGRYSTSKFLNQEALGLLLIMNTTLLFNYPYYLMLGTTGMLLFCQPNLPTNNPQAKTTPIPSASLSE